MSVYTSFALKKLVVVLLKMAGSLKFEGFILHLPPDKEVATKTHFAWTRRKK